MKVKVTWHTAKYGYPYLEFVNIQSAHTQQWKHTHTMNTNPEQWAAIYSEQLWFGALLKGTSVVVLRVEKALYIHSPHLKFLAVRYSNPQPLGYESDSLTIRLNI